VGDKRREGGGERGLVGRAGGGERGEGQRKRDKERGGKGGRHVSSECEGIPVGLATVQGESLFAGLSGLAVGTPTLHKGNLAMYRPKSVSGPVPDYWVLLRACGGLTCTDFQGASVGTATPEIGSGGLD
jgi:hypothetical protein